MQILVEKRGNGGRNKLTATRAGGGPPLLLVDRISLNGVRYIASDNEEVMKRVCEVLNVSTDWIRYSARHGKWYLRLWGSKRDV